MYVSHVLSNALKPKQAHCHCSKQTCWKCIRIERFRIDVAFPQWQWHGWQLLIVCAWGTVGLLQPVCFEYMICCDTTDTEERKKSDMLWDVSCHYSPWYNHHGWLGIKKNKLFLVITAQDTSLYICLQNAYLSGENANMCSEWIKENCGLFAAPHGSY